MSTDASSEHRDVGSRNELIFTGDGSERRAEMQPQQQREAVTVRASLQLRARNRRNEIFSLCSSLVLIGNLIITPLKSAAELEGK